jgi:hypothetical protein
MAIINGTAMWAYISAPNVKFQPQWTIDVAPEDANILEDLKARGFKVKKGQDGQEYVVIRRNVDGKNGPNKQPRLLDRNKTPINVQVGNGSNVTVQYQEYSGVGAYGPYQGLDLKAVRVNDLIEYGGKMVMNSMHLMMMMSSKDRCIL